MTIPIAGFRISPKYTLCWDGNPCGASAMSSKPRCSTTFPTSGRTQSEAPLAMVDKVFVLMPAYNAGATIERVFERIPSEARQRIQRYVAVNDGSKDDTAEALARLQREFANLIVLTHETNRGY